MSQGQLRTGNKGWSTGESLGMEASTWHSVSLSPSSSRIPSKTLKLCYDKETRVLTLAHSQITSDYCMIENSTTNRASYLGGIVLLTEISNKCARIYLLPGESSFAGIYDLKNTSSTQRHSALPRMCTICVRPPLMDSVKQPPWWQKQQRPSCCWDPRIVMPK